MRKKVCSLVFIFFLFLPFTSAGKVIDRVVGVVDGELITLSDLNEAMARYGKGALHDEKNPLDRQIRTSQVRKEVLERLIEDMLLEKVARRFGIKVEDEEVDRAIERIKKEGDITDAQMVRELTSQGFTVEGYRQFLKGRIRKARIIEQFIKPRMSMDEESRREYYRRHAKRYQHPPQLRAGHILIKVSPDAAPEELEIAKEKMKRVLQRLQEGVKFEEVAILYSEDPSARSGGDLGVFKKGDMVPMLEEVVFRMDVGEVSEVVRSSQGLHLFMVTEKKEGGAIPYEDVREQVMEDYYREEVQRLYAEWLKNLRDEANVEIKF